MLRLHPKAPHPFVIEPPITEKQAFAPGESFSFHLIFIGNAIDYLPYFIYTFTELGKQEIWQGRGRYDLVQVEGIGLEGASVEIYTHKTQTLANRYPIIFLKTPLRIRFDGQITDRLEFHVLFRNLLRRVASLSYFHCGKRWDVDFRGLIEKSRAIRQTASDIHWYDWRRYSTRQEEWMSLGGIIGSVLYEGDMSDFMPLLRLGEYVYVGKGTSFGLGKYEMW